MIRDLNSLTGPVLIFGGPYSNLQATEALLNEAARLQVPAGNIICTGDIIAYAGNPVETLEAIIQSDIHVVMGNCEESFGNEGDDCGCGFEEGSDCDVLSRQWYAHANATLTPWHRQWMRSLPRQMRFRTGDFHFAVIHGGVRDISRWVFKSTPESVKRQELVNLDGCSPADGIIAGHCGLPFVDDLGDKLWLNPGVIGMPANDGTTTTWFAVMEAGANGLVIEFHSLSYDHQAAAKSMTSLNLARAYSETLINGLWPNMDVLPEVERQQAGQPIKPETHTWRPRQLAAAE